MQRLENLLQLQDSGKYVLPVDHVTDCMDFYELACGLKGIPSDKTQRLSVLSIREHKLTSRIRNFFCPTQSMLVDALTKPMWSDTLHKFITTGYWITNNVENKPIRLRTMVIQDDYTEHDLINIDKFENTEEKREKK